MFSFVMPQVTFVKIDIDNTALGNTVNDHSITGVVGGGGGEWRVGSCGWRVVGGERYHRVGVYVVHEHA